MEIGTDQSRTVENRSDDRVGKAWNLGSFAALFEHVIDVQDREAVHRGGDGEIESPLRETHGIALLREVVAHRQPSTAV